MAPRPGAGDNAVALRGAGRCARLPRPARGRRRVPCHARRESGGRPGGQIRWPAGRGLPPAGARHRCAGPGREWTPVKQVALRARPEPPFPSAPADGAKVRGDAATLRWAAMVEADSYLLRARRRRRLRTASCSSRPGCVRPS
ncbi:MAG: hypothetical protein MZW92_13220 [Comamonadaceae bacterium]|nr:hypothetical protein [Comamonadaceae bacterium]